MAPKATCFFDLCDGPFDKDEGGRRLTEPSAGPHFTDKNEEEDEVLL